jgi:replication factor A2
MCGFHPGTQKSIYQYSAQVTLVGHIVSVQKQATNCVYKLSDGTGALEVRHWSDSISQDDGDDDDEVK